MDFKVIRRNARDQFCARIVGIIKEKQHVVGRASSEDLQDVLKRVWALKDALTLQDQEDFD